MRATLADSDRWRIAALAVVLISIGWLIVDTTINPRDQWDMLGYAASAASLESDDPNTVHAIVYDEFKGYATPESIHDLTESSQYRIVMHTDAEAFWQQIPYYKIRVIFIFLLMVLSKAGLGMFSAMHLLNVIFFSAGFLLIYSALRHRVHSLFWIVSPLIAYRFGQDLETFRAIGVDSFAFFWVALTSVGFLRKSRWLFPALALSVLVRTDLIIHVLIVFTAVCWLEHDRETLKRACLYFLVTLLLYVGVNHWAGNYGWSTVFYFAFVSNMTATHPEIYSNYSVELKDLISAYLSIKWISPWFLIAFGCGVLSLVLYQLVRYLEKTNDEFSESTKRFVLIGGISVAYVILHYLLFPALHIRFFIGQMWFMVMALFVVCTHLLRIKF